MENIKIKGSKGIFYIPTVDFDPKTGICILSGESYLEGTEEFYEPLINWLNQYTKEVNGVIIFNFSLSYYNTSSSKAIISILKFLKNYEKTGGAIEVNWYLSHDKEILEEIEDFMIETGVKINLIPEAQD
jgi:hypothetical protein